MADEMIDETPHAPKRLHCRELDGERSGILILSDDRIELYFVGYDEFIRPFDDRSAYVITEEGKVASLHDNVRGRSASHIVATKFGGRGHEGNESRKVHTTGIISNLAAIGAEAWRPEDLVRRLTFDVPCAEAVLRHGEKALSLGRTPDPSDDDLKLYRAEAGNVVLTAGYTVTYSSDTKSLSAYRPTFSIEFAVGCPLNEIWAHLFRYVSFLSFVLGGQMAPSAVRVDRLTFEEMVRALKEGTYVGDHEVMPRWPVDEDEARKLAFHGAPFLAYDDAELAAFEAALTEWVNRSLEWKGAYIRMTASLRLRRESSGERLLAAWRWFEELPNAKAERAFDSAALEPLICAASDAARDQGLGDLVDRIRGALRNVGEETARDRFARLVSSVRARFCDHNLFDGIVDHLMDARDFRGRVAHGHFAEQDEGEGRRFFKATLGMEALCFLLTARDLPMTDAGRQRILSHPILTDYRLAY